MIQVGFAGEVAKCVCKCHRGQFRVRVHAVVAGDKQELGGVNFPTEQLANEKMDAVVRDFAHRFLADVGLDPNLASQVTVTHGDEALIAEQRVRNNSNPYLH